MPKLSVKFLYPLVVVLVFGGVLFYTNVTARQNAVARWQMSCLGEVRIQRETDADGVLVICLPILSETETSTPIAETPTVEPSATPTPTEPVLGHDTTVCHGALDGHTHGVCFDDLPAGAIKDFLVEHDEFQHIEHPWVSSPVENLFPYPLGKHEGMKMLYSETAKDGLCHQFTNVNDPSGLCLKAIYLQIHSLGIADEARTADNRHSVMAIAEVCNRVGEGLGNQCGVVQVAEIENYGEIHSQYKRTGCPGVSGGVYYPSPYTVNDSNGDDAQPPYVANVVSRGNLHPPRMFWNSLRNSLMEQFVPENYLLQVAWVENAWSVPNTDPAKCADPTNDIVVADSTDAGYVNQYVIWTVKINIEDFPRPFDGFTTRNGQMASECTIANFNCLPIHIDAGVPAGDVFFNLPVRNADFSTAVEVVDITEPGVLRPGTYP